MRLFDTIKKKLENKKLQAEQARADKANKILKLPLPDKEFLIELTHLVKEDGFAYVISDYFMCDTPRANMYYGQQYPVTKITGDNIGANETLLVHSTIIEWGETAVVLIDSNDNTWSGRTDRFFYIPSSCKTIGDLNAFVSKQNSKWKSDSKGRHQAKQESEKHANDIINTRR